MFERLLLLLMLSSSLLKCALDSTSVTTAAISSEEVQLWQYTLVVRTISCLSIVSPLRLLLIRL